ncbi:MAG: oligosaccharide flippase family protein [Pseudomonadota bacterium]
MIKDQVRKLRRSMARVAPTPLTRNVGWLTGAELVSRLGRILAAVILARQLDATAFGIAAIAVTLFELVRVFTENGIGAAVVRACDRQYSRIANTAHRMMWLICVALALIQVVIGWIIEALLPGKDLGLMISALALVFLVMPFGLVHAYTLIREQRMKRLAVVGSSQAVADHLLTAVLALSGAGAWAIVLPKLLTVPVWLVGVCYGSPWKRDLAAGSESYANLVRFSLPVLGAELLAAARDQMDKVIVSLVLGVEALGLYYFAFNAGLGVSTALNRAYSKAVYPHLCAAADKARAFRKALLTLGTPLALAYLVQAAAAFVYVPLVFGDRWASAAGLVSLLCLGGPARLMTDGARMLFRSEGETGKELLATLGLTAAVLLPFAAAMPFGLVPAISSAAIGATIFAAMLTKIALQAPSPNETIANPQIEGATA